MRVPAMPSPKLHPLQVYASFPSPTLDMCFWTHLTRGNRASSFPACVCVNHVACFTWASVCGYSRVSRPHERAPPHWVKPYSLNEHMPLFSQCRRRLSHSQTVLSCSLEHRNVSFTPRNFQKYEKTCIAVLGMFIEHTKMPSLRINMRVLP